MGIAEKRKRSALMVLPLTTQDGIAMPEVSPNGGAVLLSG
jgi:hypothetical protein